MLVLVGIYVWAQIYWRYVLYLKLQTVHLAQSLPDTSTTRGTLEAVSCFSENMPVSTSSAPRHSCLSVGGRGGEEFRKERGTRETRAIFSEHAQRPRCVSAAWSSYRTS